MLLLFILFEDQDLVLPVHGYWCVIALRPCAYFIPWIIIHYYRYLDLASAKPFELALVCLTCPRRSPHIALLFGTARRSGA